MMIGLIERLTGLVGMTALVVATLLAGLLPDAAGAEVTPPDVARFVRQHCVDCHNPALSEGGLNLEAVPFDLAGPAGMVRWIRIHDRVARGEMPPASSGPLAERDRLPFLQTLSRELTSAHVASKGTILRRLNRAEYENTLNDLFGTELKLREMFPEDGRSHEFDTVGAALNISMLQMERYLAAAELVVSAAMQPPQLRPAAKSTTASYAKMAGADRFLGSQWLLRDDGAVVFFRALGYPTGMLREANAAQTGTYRIRVTGYAHQSDQPITFALGSTTFAPGGDKPTFGYFEMPPGSPTTIETTAGLEARAMIEITPQGLSDPDNLIRKNGIASYPGPGLAILQVELEGPLHDKNSDRGYRLIYDGIERREIEPRNPADKRRPWYVPRFEVVNSDLPAAARQSLLRVATAAWRRPVTAQEVEPYLQLFVREQQESGDFETALKTALTAILCSPEFLFLHEQDGSLNDWAIAQRLSYFLTRTEPDEPLRVAAAAGRLSRDPGERLRQLERLLTDPRHMRFVTDFTDAWLNLREIEFTNPDNQLFPEYDRYLLHSMVDESRAYFRVLIEENLPVRHLVKSQFAMLNGRLAEHYGIAGVSGPQIRKVMLPAGHIRGGFLTQASVLKVSANGTNSSPVVRGVYVTERILGEHAPPPPAGVPGVEPDIRGATTLRALLDQHRNLDQCKACHQMIDPPGFALESFNPIGGWREHYRSLGQGQNLNLVVHGQKVRYKQGLPVDASGELQDGRKFAGFHEFRELLAADDPRLARAITTKLLTFATGREMGFSDRAEIERIAAATRHSQFGLRDLLREIVNSPVFLNK